MDQGPQKPFWRYENGVVLMMFFTFGFVFMERLSVVYLFPYVAPDLKLNDAQLGMIVSVLAICWALSGFFFGTISDFLGSRKNVLVPITLAFSLLSFLTGVAKNFGQMLGIRALMGVSEGPVLPIAQAAVMADSSEARRGFNMGFVQSALGLIGSTFGPLILTWAATKYSWHAGFYVAGIPGLIMFFVLLFFMKEPNKRMSKEELAKSEHRLRKEDFPVVFRTWNIWFTLLIAILMMTWLFAFTSFAPTFLVEYDHYTGEQMGVISAAMGLGTFFWGFMGPYISDKWGRRPTLVLFSFIAVLSPLVLIFVHGSVALMCVLGFLTCAGQACFPLFMVVIPGESLSPKYVGTAVGLVQMVGELIGGAVMPTVAGVAADHFGLPAPMWIAAAGAFVSGIMAFFIRETAPVRLRRRGQVAASEPVQL
ncbi:MFS transporter [Alicyclobacillus sendaiensis]|uniref:MFS transporter n=1 Tax=Alicyclobacillus sendaiensis TaxID=192387 RepID=UPI0026F43A50|nr:MFS transporter [Alicyclobacillus sendaiensis]